MSDPDFDLFAQNLRDPFRIRCIMSNARRMAGRRFKSVPNWSLAMELFGVGSTYGWKICRLARIDGDSTSTTLAGGAE